MDSLERQGPKAVVFDYFFPERTIADNADWSLIAKLEKRTEADISELYDRYSDTIYKDKAYVNSNDEDFRSLMEKHGNVFLPYSFKADAQGKLLPEQDRKVYSLYGSASKSGFVNAAYDSEGRIVRISPKIGEADSLALAVAKSVGPVEVPNPAGEYLNYFSKPYDAFTAIQFHKAYNEEFVDYSGKEISLKDKIVIVGDYHESL